jgi:hypothetical protein
MNGIDIVISKARSLPCGKFFGNFSKMRKSKEFMGTDGSLLKEDKQ